jgi:hypothetical protein
MFGWFTEASVCASRLKRASRLRIVRKQIGKDFQGDIAIEPGVAGSKDLPHPTFADRRGDVVNAEASADRNCQM